MTVTQLEISSHMGRSESFNRFNVSLKDSDIFFRDYRTGPEFLISSDTSNFEMFSLNLDANSSAA